MDKTTPRPWSANNPYGYVHGRDGNNPIGHFNEWEDGKLAIKAVNSYDATQAALKALVEVVERIKFQKSPLHGGLVVAKHSGAEAYFAETLALMDKALRRAQEVLK